jgi:spore germination cell wall hydrolase CwlJ-like protein
MKKLTFAATVCIALFLSTAAVAGDCDELNVLALNIYHEARGEPEKGMWMVGEVTINRVASSHYPDSICDVVYQRSKKGAQFSWVSSKKNKTPKDQKAWKKSLRIAKELLNDNKMSYPHLATHFVNLNVVKPRWTRQFDKVDTIGVHTFYRM